MTSDGGRRYALFDLVRSGEVERIEAHIRTHHASIRERSITGALPLQVAIDVNRWDIVVILVRADPEHITLALQTTKVSLLEEAVRRKVDESIVLELIAAAPQYIGQPTYTSLDTPKYPIFRLIDSHYVEAAAALVLLNGNSSSNHVTDDDGNSIAHAACKCSHPFPLPALTVLLERLVTAVNLDGQSPIHVAASSGNVHALQCAMALTSCHAATLCTMADRAGSLPLHIAVAERHWHVVVPLATWYPPAVAVADPMGDLAVHIAAGCRQWPVVLALIETAPHTATVADRLGRSMLRLALHGAAWSVAGALLGIPGATLPSDVDSIDIAVEQAQWLIAGQLLEKKVAVPQPLAAMKLACQLGAPTPVLAGLAERLPGVSTDEKTIGGQKKDADVAWTTMALDVALRHRQWDVAAWVLATDATAARRKNRMRLLPLQVAAAANAAPDWLLQRLAEAHPHAAVAVDRTGTPLVHVLCRRHHWACVRALVRAAPTAATSARDPQGFSVVHLSMHLLAPADVVVELAVAAPHTTSTDGSSWVLHDVLTKYALSLSGATDIPRLAAAFSSCCDAKCNTALHVGISCDHVGFCAALVRDHGADVFAVNACGESALDLARQSPNATLRALFAPMDVEVVAMAAPPPAAWLEKEDSLGLSPLVHAALAENWTAVQWMLQHGANSALIQALKLPRKVQRAVATSQHAHVVVHHRYVVHTTREAPPTGQDDDDEGLAMDLKTGHNVRLVSFGAKHEQDAYCIRVDTVQRRSSFVCGVLDTFESDGAYVVVLEGAGRFGDVLSCTRPPGPAADVAKIVMRALADVDAGDLVHVCLTPASFSCISPGVIKLHDLAHCRTASDAFISIDRLWTRLEVCGLRFQSPQVALALLPQPTTAHVTDAVVAITASDNAWTLGVILFELLTGEPWADPTLQGAPLLVALAFPSQDDIDGRLIRHALPRPVLDILQGLLSIHSSHRTPLSFLVKSEFLTARIPLASTIAPAPVPPKPTEATSATSFLPWTPSELVALALQNHKAELDRIDRQHRRAVISRTKQSVDVPLGPISSREPPHGDQGRPEPQPATTSADPIQPSEIDVEPEHDGVPGSLAVKTNDPFVGERVRKRFADSVVYHGTVASRSPDGDFWTVVYDDGDSEDLTQAELADIVVKKTLKGHLATARPLAQGDAVWLVHHHQLVARARVYATPPADMTPLRPPGDDVVCLRITKRFTGTPAAVSAQFVQCRTSAKSAWFVWWRLAHCFVPAADTS